MYSLLKIYRFGSGSLGIGEDVGWSNMNVCRGMPGNCVSARTRDVAQHSATRLRMVHGYVTCKSGCKCTGSRIQYCACIVLHPLVLCRVSFGKIFQRGKLGALLGFPPSPLQREGKSVYRIPSKASREATRQQATFSPMLLAHVVGAA